MQGRLQRLPREERQLNSGLCHQHRVLRLPVDVEASHRSDQHGGQCAREPGLQEERYFRFYEQKKNRVFINLHSYIKPCFSVLGTDFFHFNSSAGSFYKDEKMAKNTEFEIVSSEIL